MAKYIDAERLKAEIKERTRFYEGQLLGDFGDGYLTGIRTIPQIIDSLQQEQPDVDIEREIDEHSEQMPMSEFTHESEAEEFTEWAKKEFRHFYERGLNARKK